MKNIYKYINTPILLIPVLYYVVYLVYNYTNTIYKNATVVEPATVLIVLIMIYSLLTLIASPLIILALSTWDEIYLLGNKKVISKHNVYVWKIKRDNKNVILYVYKCGLLWNALATLTRWENKMPLQIEIIEYIQKYIDNEDKNIDDINSLNTNIKYTKEEFQNWKGNDNV